MSTRGKPTLADVARRAGVGLKTAARVVNGEGNVAPPRAARVREAIAELGYQRNEVAAWLRSEKVRQLGTCPVCHGTGRIT